MPKKQVVMRPITTAAISINPRWAKSRLRIAVTLRLFNHLVGAGE